MKNKRRAAALAFHAVLGVICACPAPASVLTAFHGLDSSPAAKTWRQPEAGLFYAAAGLSLQATGQRAARLVDFLNEYTDPLGFLRSRIWLARPLSPENVCSSPELQGWVKPAVLPRPESVRGAGWRIHSPDDIGRALEGYLTQPATGSEPSSGTLDLAIGGTALLASRRWRFRD